MMFNVPIIIKNLLIPQKFLFCVFLLCSSIVYGQNYTNESLVRAVESKDSLTIVRHLEAGIRPDFNVKEGEVSIPYYLQLLVKEQFNAVDIFRASGFEIPSRVSNTTPLIYAAFKGNEEMMNYLLDHGAAVNDTNSYGWLAIHYAARDGKTEILKQLLAHHSDVNKVGRTTIGKLTPLMLAVRNGHFEACVLLLQAGANTNYTNEKSQTAYSLAEEFNRYWVKEVLNNPKQIQNIYFTYVVNNKDYEKAFQLLNEKIDPAYQIAYGWTTLHYAAQYGQRELLEELLKYTNKIDIQKEDGFSPLMLAAYNNQFETSLFLFENNASPLLKNKEGETVIELVDKLGYIDIKNLFYDPQKAKEQYELNKQLWGRMH
jgi:ankyrin repeat protein